MPSSLIAEAFPAPAGMNRARSSAASSMTRVPRTRGDEPAARAYGGANFVRSPHPRG